MIPDFAYHAAAYMARRAIRSGDIAGYLRRSKALNNRTVLRFTEILPPLLASHCIAEAEARAIEQIKKEGY